MFVQVFYAWHGLVVASLKWPPHFSVCASKDSNFVKNVLLQDRFNLIDFNSYFEGV